MKGGDLEMRLCCGGSGSSGNCYALQSDKEILLLDNGVSTKAMMPLIDFRISDICGCLITHSHS